MRMNLYRKPSFMLATIASIGASVLACAQPPGAEGPGFPGGGNGGPGGERRPNPIIEALDVDHDRNISAEEIKAAATALLSLDKNKDGQLSVDEYRPAGAGGPGAGGPGADGGRPGGEGPRAGSSRRGGGADAGGRDQGPASPERNPERFVNHAMEFDADGDGKLSRDELLKFAESLPPPSQRGPQAGPGERGPGEAGPASGPGGPGGPGNRRGPRGGGDSGPQPVRPTRPSSDQ